MAFRRSITVFIFRGLRYLLCRGERKDYRRQVSKLYKWKSNSQTPPPNFVRRRQKEPGIWLWERTEQRNVLRWRQADEPACIRITSGASTKIYHSDGFVHAGHFTQYNSFQKISPFKNDTIPKKHMSKKYKHISQTLKLSFITSFYFH